MMLPHWSWVSPPASVRSALASGSDSSSARRSRLSAASRRCAATQGLMWLGFALTEAIIFYALGMAFVAYAIA